MTMEKAFCTIITRSHLPWALAMASSLRDVEPDLPVYVLVTDTIATAFDGTGAVNDVHLLFLSDVAQDELAQRVITTYGSDSNALRWCMKPVLMEHLLRRYGKVVYGDCDLFFFGPLDMIWQGLDTWSVLLTPHWRSARVGVDRPNFDLLYVGGLYNAGFVAAQRAGLPALRSWAENCLGLCVKDFTIGQCDDQAHLNLLPVYFEDVGIVRHRGCNVANWNMVECKRTRGPHGAVLINGVDPVVFIHFTRSTIDGIVRGDDPLLMPHVEQLRDRLLHHGHGVDIVAQAQERIVARQQHVQGGFLPKVRRSIRRITGI
jgi:hypothetical protein